MKRPRKRYQNTAAGQYKARDRRRKPPKARPVGLGKVKVNRRPGRKPGPKPVRIGKYGKA